MTTDKPSLCLHDEILLLALRDEEGTTEIGSQYAYAIGGAVLAELLLRNRIRLDTSKKRGEVQLVNAKPLGEPLLDDALERIRDAKKRASAQTWVSRFANLKNLKHRVAERLCDRGILGAEKEKILLLFDRRVYPEIDPGPETDIVERLRQAIFGDSDQLDARTVVLVSLANSVDLLKSTFDKKALKSRQQRIQQVIDGEAAGMATKAAVEAVQAALIVTAVLPAVITSSTH